MESLEVSLLITVARLEDKAANLRCLAMPLGLVGEDIVVLNEHSLWSGGPFQSPVSLRSRLFTGSYTSPTVD